jgi:hypothetical protein
MCCLLYKLPRPSSHAGAAYGALMKARQFSQQNLGQPKAQGAPVTLL